MRYVKRAVYALLSILALGGTLALRAQTDPLSVLSGVVTDPSGAKVAQAGVRVQGDLFTRQLTSNGSGRFTLGLPPGTYDVLVSSPGFADFERKSIVLDAGRSLELAIVLSIATHKEEVSVPSDEAGATTDPAANVSALIFKSEQLALFSDDDATLQQQLSAIAGSDDGLPPQIYVDGYTSTRLPPKSTIREVRINQNPLSAQYDRRGFSRIEVTTKPGSDKFHGGVTLLGNDQPFNAVNPCRPVCGASAASLGLPVINTPEPPYHSFVLDGNLGGPLGKHSSFFISGNHNDLQYNSITNADDPAIVAQETPFSQVVYTPQLTDTFSARYYGQPNARNILNVRYEFFRTHATNAGLSLLTLPSEAYNSFTTAQTLQAGATQVLRARMFNEARFQYVRTRVHQDPVDNSPTVIVQGSFYSGGSPNQNYRDNQDSYEFQDHLSWENGAHSWRVGMRYRLLRDSNLSTANYNGQYIFPSFTAYQITKQGQARGDSADKIRTTCVTTATGTICGGPSQFSITRGRPDAVVLTGDLGAYAEDTWKLRKDLTLSIGVRLESQFGIPDHWDPAPRIGLSWAVPQRRSKTPLFVLRPSFAMFYDRFPAAQILQSVRQNGINQQTYFQQNPEYCNPLVPCIQTNLMTSPQQLTIYQLDPKLRSQYDLLAAISAERSFGARGSVSLTYTDYRGVHQFLLRNANAPLPGTYVPGQPTSGVRPLGGNQNIYQYSSTGITKGRGFTANANWSPARHAFLMAFYSMQRRYTDAGGPAVFASDPYNVSADYGRSGLVPLQRLVFGGSTDLPWNFGLSTFISAHSGLPFNITTGQDFNGDTVFNDRPAFATDLSRPSVVHTAQGTFDTSPLPSQTLVPNYYGDSPDYVSWQVSLGRSFKVGPRPAPSATSAQGNAAAPVKTRVERPWEFGFSLEVQNLLNHTNRGTPIGVLSSPFFDRSLSLADVTNTNPAANRTLTLRTYFTF